MESWQPIKRLGDKKKKKKKKKKMSNTNFNLFCFQNSSGFRFIYFFRRGRRFSLF